MIPYEQAALNREPMPPGLEFPDQLLFIELRNLYGQYKLGLISREHCVIEKRFMLDEYRRNKFSNELSKLSVRLFQETEKSRAAYRLNRTVENADALLMAIDGVM